jgi:hypothetical protein
MMHAHWPPSKNAMGPPNAARLGTHRPWGVLMDRLAAQPVTSSDCAVFFVHILAALHPVELEGVAGTASLGLPWLYPPWPLLD